MIRILLPTAALCVVLSVSAQNFKVNAPNSAFGIGEYFNEGTARNRAMGGLGVSTSNQLFINALNPALYTQTKYTVFEAALLSQYRSLKTDDLSRRDGDIIPAYLAICFPISKGWKSGVSLSPYTYSNFSSFTTTEVAGATSDEYITTTVEGSGGLNKASFSNGLKIGSSLSLGLSASYIFGKQEINQTSQLSTSSNNTALNQEYIYKGFQFTGGMAFRKQLKKVNVPKRSKLVLKNPNYLSKKEQLEICMDSLRKSELEGLKDHLDDCMNNMVEIPKKSIHQDTLINRDVYFAKDFIDSIATTAIHGKYFSLIPNYSALIYHPSIKDRVLKIKIKKFLKDYNTASYGVFVKKEIQDADQKIWFEDLVKLLIDSTSVATDQGNKNVGHYLKRKSGVFFNTGFSYLFASNINTDGHLYENTFSSSGVLVSSDTLSSLSNKTRLPMQVTFGISLDKPLAKGTKKDGSPRKSTWSLGAEAFFMNGNDYTHSLKGNDLSNSYGVRLGGEIIPDINSKLQSEFLKRVFYRFGTIARVLPYEQNGRAIRDIGVTFGVGLPIGRYDFGLNFPKYVNLSFELGKRGELNKGQIKENYFFTTLGFTINDKWFKRSKIGL